MSERSLSEFTREELLAELVRRENIPKDEQNAPWCEDCAHFKAFAGSGEVPKTYNPCGRGHQPNFWMPHPWESPENYGFYRPVCEDRKAIPEHHREIGAGPTGVPRKPR